VSDSKPTVIEALSAVMGDVQAVGKTGRNTQQNYNFRGVDAVVNAVGPALRTHGVVVVPVAAAYEVEHYETRNGARMRGVTATVTFRFYGPAGDSIDAQVCGESSDAGDKATPKAHSVAYRTMLLQALCIPTDEPDPDEESHERAAEAAKPKATPKTTITEPQRKRLFAVASSAGVTPERIKELMKATAGVESSNDIPKAKYDALIAAVEAEKVAA
jgi:hypothetical protein